MIRLAEHRDFEGIADITNHYIQTTAIHFGYEDVGADELRAGWLEHQDVYPWLVTTDPARSIGDCSPR